MTLWFYWGALRSFFPIKLWLCYPPHQLPVAIQLFHPIIPPKLRRLSFWLFVTSQPFEESDSLWWFPKSSLSNLLALTGLTQSNVLDRGLIVSFPLFQVLFWFEKHQLSIISLIEIINWIKRKLNSILSKDFHSFYIVISRCAYHSKFTCPVQCHFWYITFAI